MEFESETVGNNVGKGENAGHPLFSFSQNIFKKFIQSFKLEIMWLYANRFISTYKRPGERRLFIPLLDDKILDWSKLKQFADNNFKFDENSRKFSKWVENTVGKGEIARYEQFLLFSQCFQKACFPGASNGVIVWEWVNPLPDHKILDWSKLKQFADDDFKSDENSRKFSKRVENTVGKGEIAR